MQIQVLNEVGSDPSARPVSSSCKVCTIRLERLCYQRAWWFRAFREVFATGIRLFAVVYRVKPDDYVGRSKACHKCIRFRKNVLKERSRLFRWLDGYLNPLFNGLRDSLLTPEELEEAREFARRAVDPQFNGDGNGEHACLRKQ